MFDKSLKGPIVYIRHAQSVFNQLMLDEKNLYLKNSRDLIDCGITDLGKSQCEVLSKTLQECKVRTVFISPLNRTIETCYYSMKDHPDFLKIKFVVLPLASEMIDSSCDIPVSMSEKKKIFQKYKNFELVWDLYKDFYFLDNIDERNFVLILKDVNFSNYEQNYFLFEKGLEVCRADKKSGETVKHLYSRSVELKKYLKAFLADYQLENNEKILVFAHSAITRISTSYLAHSLDEMEEFPEDCIEVENCECLTVNID